MDGPMLRAYEAALLIVLVSTLALWVASCAPKPERHMDWGAVAEAYERSRKP